MEATCWPVMPYAMTYGYAVIRVGPMVGHFTDYERRFPCYYVNTNTCYLAYKGSGGISPLILTLGLV
jgi:hypothetical protein